jgi:Arc/MetJ-type ribon-helix-helix transcriptional regulator
MSEQSLDLLMREGLNESEAVRAALVEAGRRRRQRSALADEVRRLAADEQDRAARQRLMADMESIAPDWPE